MHYDVFNGDADGICALIQLRLARPIDAALVTGIKRDIQLLDKVSVNAGDSLTVLDISFDKNAVKVAEILSAGADIFYADHHRADKLFQHSKLTALIDTDSSVCTSLLVNNYLGGKFPLWAVIAAYGDNLARSAEQLAATVALSGAELATLKSLGTYVNYNGYGESIEDLYFAPNLLYQAMVRYVSPFGFISENHQIYESLEEGYWQDMRDANTRQAEFQDEAIAVFILPDLPWARRVSGVFGNHLANQEPSKAHAVLTYNKNGGYLVSVRAPLINKVGADVFCLGFATGGGRQAAAGINHLPQESLVEFIDKFQAFYSSRN